jgi:hypothetical protein
MRGGLPCYEASPTTTRINTPLSFMEHQYNAAQGQSLERKESKEGEKKKKKRRTRPALRRTRFRTEVITDKFIQKKRGDSKALFFGGEGEGVGVGEGRKQREGEGGEAAIVRCVSSNNKRRGQTPHNQLKKAKTHTEREGHPFHPPSSLSPPSLFLFLSCIRGDDRRNKDESKQHTHTRKETNTTPLQ